MPAKKSAPQKKSKARTKPAARHATDPNLPVPPAAREHFPVVGLGASAGGLDALKAFFQKVPEESGLAYIVNVHLTPKRPSLMPELLQRVTRGCR